MNEFSILNPSKPKKKEKEANETPAEIMYIFSNHHHHHILDPEQNEKSCCRSKTTCAMILFRCDFFL